MEHENADNQPESSGSPHETPGSKGDSNAEGDSHGRAQTIQGDWVHGHKVAGDLIMAEVGAGAQNVVVGSGNTQIIGYTAEQVAVIITQIRRADQPQGWNGRTPYIGLDAFSEQQANLFFGRESLVTHLLTRVQASRFLCITGPSGSGKSSLVQAGLIAGLRAGKLPGSEQWLVETVRPGNQPLENLALGLGRLAKSPAAAAYFRQHGTSDPAALHAQMETLLSHQRNQRAVIVVDQFEEIFTQTKDEALRLAFLTLLTCAVRQVDGRVSVLLTMRSDFVSHCATYADLRQVISGQLELVGAMAPEELARAIALPALEVGVEVQPDLVAQVIADMRGEPGALPLMQFALKDLFDAQPKEPGQPVVLTLQEYLARGGIQQALERHANAQFVHFSPAEQAIARKIFMSLIEVGRGTVDTRRTAAFRELLPPGVDASQVEKVVQTLADARLITTDNLLPVAKTADAGETRNVTLAHEKLIEAWPWLQQLVRENRALIELQNQISEDATAWIASQRDASYLYSGARLQTAQERLAAHQLALSVLAQQFLDVSVQAEAQRQQQIETERQRELEQARLLTEEQRRRAEEQTQAAQRLRQRNQWLGLALAGALLLALVALLFFRQAQNEAKARAAEVVIRTHAQATAESARDEAQQQARRAKAGELAAAAGREIAQPVFDPSLALLLAMRAVTMTQPSDGAIFVNAVTVLDTVVRQASPWRMTLPADRVAFSPDGTRILTASDDNPSVHLWDSATGAARLTLAGHTDRVYLLAFSSDGKRIITASKDNTARLWAVDTGQTVLTLPADNATVSADGTRLVTIKDNTVHLWEATTGQAVLTLPGHTASSTTLIVNRDGTRLLTVTEESSMVQLWDAVMGQALSGGEGYSVVSPTFSPDGTRIAVDRPSRLMHSATSLLDAVTGEELLAFPGGEPVFSPDGAHVVTWGSDNTADLWDGATGEPLLTLPGRMTDRFVAAFSSEGARIAVANDDNTVRVWNVGSEQALLTLHGYTAPVMAITFSPDGAYIATTSEDHTVRIWDATLAQPLLTIASFNYSGLSTAFSPNGARIVTTGNDVRSWDATTGNPVLQSLPSPTNIDSIELSPDGKWIAARSPSVGDNKAYVWDAESGQLLLTLAGHTGEVSSAVFSPDSKRIVTSSSDQTARVWDVERGQPLLILAGFTTTVWSAIFSPDGKRIATTTYGNQQAQLWDAARGQRLLTLAGHTDEVWSTVFSDDGAHLLTLSLDNTVCVWDTTTGQLLHTLAGHTDTVRAARFSPDGARIFTWSNDGTARMWDGATGQQLYQFPAQLAAFSRDGTRIITAIDGNPNVDVWDAATGQRQLTLEGHTAPITSLAFSPDGAHIVTASDDATIRTWFSSVNGYLAAAQRRVQRTPPVFTPAEREKYSLDE